MDLEPVKVQNKTSSARLKEHDVSQQIHDQSILSNEANQLSETSAAVGETTSTWCRQAPDTAGTTTAHWLPKQVPCRMDGTAQAHRQ